MSKSAVIKQQQRRKNTVDRNVESIEATEIREFTRRADQEVKRAKGRLVYDFEIQDFVEI